MRKVLCDLNLIKGVELVKENFHSDKLRKKMKEEGKNVRKSKFIRKLLAQQR